MLLLLVDGPQYKQRQMPDEFTTVARAWRAALIEAGGEPNYGLDTSKAVPGIGPSGLVDRGEYARTASGSL